MSGQQVAQDILDGLSEMGRAALRYARLGLPVFPCREITTHGPNLDKTGQAKEHKAKSPYTAHGCHDATTDLGQVVKWWKRFPAAAIGLRTGIESGLFVVDVDVKNGAPGLESWEALQAQFGPTPMTRTVRTASDGFHYYFKHPGQGNTIKTDSGSLGAGIDLRGDGNGYVIAAGSVIETGSYVYEQDMPTATAPEWLLDRAVKKPRPEQPSACRTIMATTSSGYGENALQTECGLLAKTPAGQRHDQLFKSVAAMGGLIAGGELVEQEARVAIMAAIESWGTGAESESKTLDTIEDALERGMSEPRTAPYGESGWNLGSGQRDRTSMFVSSSNSSEDLDAWTPTTKAWPILEQAALLGIVGDLVAVATEKSEADQAAVLATLLVRFGVEAGSPEPNVRPHVYVGESKHEPRINAVVVGKSAKARKGTSGAPVARLFNVPKGSVDAPVMASTSLGPLSTGEGIVYAVRDAMEAWDEKMQKFNLIDPGVNDKRLYVQEEEFAAAINAGKRDGNTLSATLRALWDSGTRSPLTKTSRTKCTDAHVGILAHITLDELAISLSACDKLNGYANRFLWVLARRNKRVPRPEMMPDDLFIPIQDEIWRRLQLAHSTGRMCLTSAAGDLWDWEYDRLTEDRPGIAGTITARAEAQVVRLSMIYALIDGKSHIDVLHVEAALAMWRYAQASAEYIFNEDSVGSKLDCKVKEILTGVPAGMSLTEIHKATGNNHKATILHKSIQRLVDAGLVRSELVRFEGVAKPKTIFISNEQTNLRIYSEMGQIR